MTELKNTEALHLSAIDDNSSLKRLSLLPAQDLKHILGRDTHFSLSVHITGNSKTEAGDLLQFRGRGKR